MSNNKQSPNSNTTSRQDLLEVIASNPFQSPGDARFWHGRIFSDEEEDGILIPPTMTWESPEAPRADKHNTTATSHQRSREWLTASEFQDADSVMNLKIQKLAQLLKQSKKTIVYSGAGISVSAGIGQAARGSSSSSSSKNNRMAAKPTPTHYALGALASSPHNLIHGWVQQNHDGLPQKAGFPQDRINEIHGSWFDPSNPVVKYSGSLRKDEYQWMIRDAHSADLVLVLGTSLSGLNADQVAIHAANRSLTILADDARQKKSSLGMVIINLQQTPQDGKASLRIFGSTDRVFRQLFHHLSVRLPKSPSPKRYKFPKDKKFLVPYNAQGELYFVSNHGNNNKNNNNNNNNNNKMIWDLNVNAKVQIVNHNIEGAAQPSHQPILAQNPTLQGRIIGWDDECMSIQISISGQLLRMGYWWIETAMQGKALALPLVNQHMHAYMHT
ncbi:MAG: hypothetical protein SGBAC_006101 [Bacillariaceae sp.]